MNDRLRCDKCGHVWGAYEDYCHCHGPCLNPEACDGAEQRPQPVTAEVCNGCSSRADVVVFVERARAEEREACARAVEPLIKPRPSDAAAEHGVAMWNAAIRNAMVLIRAPDQGDVQAACPRCGALRSVKKGADEVLFVRFGCPDCNRLPGDGANNDTEEQR